MNTQIIIERNVPMPKRQYRGKWQSLIDQMQTGDSVLLPVRQGQSFVASLTKRGFRANQRRDGENIRVWKGEQR